MQKCSHLVFIIRMWLGTQRVHVSECAYYEVWVCVKLKFRRLCSMNELKTHFIDTIDTISESGILMSVKNR